MNILARCTPDALRPADGQQDTYTSEVAALQRQLTLLQKDLEDRQRTEALRDKAAGVLKEELAEVRRLPLHAVYPCALGDFYKTAIDHLLRARKTATRPLKKDDGS